MREPSLDYRVELHARPQGAIQGFTYPGTACENMPLPTVFAAVSVVRRQTGQSAHLFAPHIDRFRQEGQQCRGSHRAHAGNAVDYTILFRQRWDVPGQWLPVVCRFPVNVASEAPDAHAIRHGMHSESVQDDLFPPLSYPGSGPAGVTESIVQPIPEPWAYRSQAPAIAHIAPSSKHQVCPSCQDGSAPWRSREPAGD